MERIEHLRLLALKDDRFSDEWYYLFHKAYHTTFAQLPKTERYAEAFYDAFANMTPYIAGGELIVGYRGEKMSPEDEAQWQNIYKPMAEELSRGIPGQDSHMAVDYDLLLHYGIQGIQEKIDGYMAACQPENQDFYCSCKRCLAAVVKHSENYADAALAISMKTPDPQRRAELQEISRICRKVPANPAETFYEAVQSVHFLTYCLSLSPIRLNTKQFQLGHPDRYLLPYYKRDLKEGRITREYAQLLLDCLGVQINMRVQNGLSSGYMVGGRDENGEIVANELTQMCMQVIENIRLVFPAVGFCYTEGMPEKYLDTACRILAKGHSHPAIFNDDVITKGLRHYGVSERESHNYIHSTCVEITPVAASNVWVASPYTNMVQILLDAMNREYDSFDQLMAEILGRLDRSIKANLDEQIRQRRIRAENCMNPILSCFVNDCLQRGLDIEQGGGKYNWIMPSFVGMANLIDSLFAVKELIFEKKMLSMAELKAVLDRNFEGHADLRAYVMNRIPKYGNDLDEIDSMFSFFTEHIIHECEKHKGVFSNADLIPSVFCWVMHERFGRETSATPDGRLAGFPLGDGSGPCQGRELKGPTASVLSSTKWDHHKMIGGVAVNLKFSKATLGKDSLEVMKAIVKTYLARGGFEVQINVVDNETLLKARNHPEQYRDLVVRIGGYSDYFVKLSAEMQDEVIARTTHGI